MSFDAKVMINEKLTAQLSTLVYWAKRHATELSGWVISGYPPSLDGRPAISKRPVCGLCGGRGLMLARLMLFTGSGRKAENCVVAIDHFLHCQQCDGKGRC